ncbi:MAG: Rne/Rng family ribonuclease, partial [Phycisphaerae bacterium]|nr:Rne/Rng family ribonuclease [Phycisphaerae bacterium]
MSTSRMVINYVPREECRIAVVEDGKLEELYVERSASASRVGNIYVGRVTNVEPAIQAAFVDFGVEENGFLHISDLHPRYFPGEDEDTTERVGLKTPRRERPPIQHALRRGDEIIVQVLKEGIGTKGPTLTSYLSIPGRFLVMMPHMDKVGVSRKVEDEELRAQMRAILDQLELPEGFGFILRTAGLERNKTELKRDLAYLQRLWKDMERRLKEGGRTRLLYSESDLLVRALRDHLTTEVQEVVIDHEQALRRASRFLKIVAPRSQVRLMQHPGNTPIFHAFDVERQISMIHAREVPLPSGGRLVFDETEAVVCIDVNSGRSRDARDAEVNAYRTNLEAIEEIARQLRLRDLGGIVINDLIDMRSAAHRRDVEGKFKERLKRDRAKTTVASISPFGILEMTRQRMRGSHESIHFAECPTCRGRGVIMKPDSIAADALRELQALLEYEQVAKVEVVVAPRVAGELLSTKRQLLNRIERLSGRHVDVRVSEGVPLDRPSFYAYDAGGADIDISKLRPSRKQPTLVEWTEHKAEEEVGGDAWAVDAAREAPAADEDHVAEEAVEEPEPHPIEFEPEGEPAGWTKEPGEAPGGEAAPGRRRRRRRRGRGRGAQEQAPGREPAPTQDAVVVPGAPASERVSEAAGATVNGEAVPQAQEGEGGRGRRRRRRRGRGRGGAEGQGPSPVGEGAPPERAPSPPGEPPPTEARDERGAAEQGEVGGESAPGGGRRRRRRR